jgi:plasmid stability protein
VEVFGTPQALGALGQSTSVQVSPQRPDSSTVDSATELNCYHSAMRQLITRVDDDLHAALKTRAAEQGRSVNSVVVEALTEAIVQGRAPRLRWRERARRANHLVERPGKADAAARNAAIEATRGVGPMADELLADRAHR